MESVGLLTALRRHMALVAALALLGLLVGVVVGAIVPRTYSARATLFLRVQAASTSLYERSQFALQRVQSYPQLLDSPSLLSSVISTLGLNESPQQLDRQLSAENPTNTVLLNVTATASTAKGAADIANAAALELATNVNALENNETTSKNAVSLVPQITAQAPASPSSPNLAVVLGLGLIAGLVIGAIIALTRERFSPRVRTVADVRRVTGLPVVAEVPRNVRGRLAATTVAAVNLRTLTKGTIPQLLLLAPADQRAERAGAQLNLAWGLAQTGRRILAIAGPTSPLAEYGLELADGSKGFSEVLSGTASVDRSSVRAAEHGFDVLPIGDAAVAPSAFELERAGAAVFTPLVQQHDVTVLQVTADSLPLGLDTAGRVARSALVVVARNTAEHDARRLVARLHALDIVPVGVVLTDVGHVSSDLLESWTESDFVQARRELVQTDGSLPTRSTGTSAPSLDSAGARPVPAEPREVVEVGASDRR